MNRLRKCVNIQLAPEIESRFSALGQLEQTVEAGLLQSLLKKSSEGRLLTAQPKRGRSR